MSTPTDDPGSSSFSSSTNGNGRTKRGWRARLQRLLHKPRDEDLHDLIADREEDTPFTQDDKELIAAALHFSSIEADDVSVARSDIVAVKHSASFQDCLAILQENRYSRMPVYGEDLDDILGFITFKDVMLYVGKEKTFEVGKILRAATFVPDAMPIPQVLQLMKKNKVQMALVVDEYGGTAGLITLKDILEELVGDMTDEHEEATLVLVALKGGRYRLDPKMSLEDFATHLGQPLAADLDDLAFETVGGLVLSLAGRVPEQGETFDLPTGQQLKVTESDGRRILGLEILPRAHDTAQPV